MRYKSYKLEDKMNIIIRSLLKENKEYLTTGKRSSYRDNCLILKGMSIFYSLYIQEAKWQESVRQKS